MDAIVDSMEKAYQEFVTAAAIVLETSEANGGKQVDGVDPSLGSFVRHLQLFKGTCDEAQEFVEYLKNSLECGKFPDNLSYSPEQVSDNDHSNSPIKADDDKTSKTCKYIKNLE
ncbi:putative nogo-B receptor-like [Capsicum annuum]|nr:putative nogo-B receptor-like [Capsicum annuum]